MRFHTQALHRRHRIIGIQRQPFAHSALQLSDLREAIEVIQIPATRTGAIGRVLQWMERAFRNLGRTGNQCGKRRFKTDRPLVTEHAVALCPTQMRTKIGCGAPISVSEGAQLRQEGNTLTQQRHAHLPHQLGQIRFAEAIVPRACDTKRRTVRQQTGLPECMVSDLCRKPKFVLNPKISTQCDHQIVPNFPHFANTIYFTCKCLERPIGISRATRMMQCADDPKSGERALGRCRVRFIENSGKARHGSVETIPEQRLPAGVTTRCNTQHIARIAHQLLCQPITLLRFGFRPHDQIHIRMHLQAIDRHASTIGFSTIYKRNGRMQIATGDPVHPFTSGLLETEC
ncbi:hypothetical protein WL37_17315 [Burkholderia ubonensis]|nr:hypothetical protein WL37_17315 [Burkholderia ubonensis]